MSITSNRVGDRQTTQPTDGTATTSKKIRNFVTTNFEYAECNCYVKAASVDTGICGCGRDNEWHEKRELPRGIESTTWSTEKHTKTLPSSYFGTIKFSGFDSFPLDEAKYIRVFFDDKQEDTTKQHQNKTNKQQKVVQDVVTLLKDYWNVPSPGLIISVIGGAKDFHLSSKLRENFKKVLIRAASSTGAWIVTGGYKEGVMQLVGEAVYEHNITQAASSDRLVALGIGTWGVCNNKEALAGTEQEGKFPAEYSAGHLRKEDGIASLDPNHTHFILVDNGTEKQSGKEIKFRAAFEDYIALNKVDDTNKADNMKNKVPIFYLMVNGGPNTLKTALKAVENDCPLVVARGSGRMADIVANTDEKAIDAELETNSCFKANVDAIRQDLNTLKEKKKVFAFSLDDKDDSQIKVDDKDDSQMEVILKALLEGPARHDLVAQLKMTLAFNMSAVARRDIFKETWRQDLSKSLQNKQDEPDHYQKELEKESSENRPNTKDENRMFNKFLKKALLQDKAEFVQLFMDNGADLTNFLDVRTLRNLYFKTVLENEKKPVAGELKSVILKFTKIEDCPINLLWHVSVAIGKLLGDKQPAVYPTKDYGDVEYDNMVKSDANNKGKSAEDPVHHLFLWAILLNKQHIGELFWKLDKDNMGGALIAVKLLNSLAEEAKRGSEITLQEDLKKHAKIYEKYALDVLSECYDLDKDRTHKLLTRQLKNETTVFSLAESSTQMEFMAHTACQTKLNKLLQGRMKQTSSDFQIILCIFLPFLVKTFNWRPPDDKSNELKSEKDLANESSLGTKKQGGKENGTSEKDHGNASGSDVSFIDAFSMFFKIAKVKFYVHTISYVIFLALYSYFVLVSLQDTDRENWLSVDEFILWFWIITLIVEEFRQGLITQWMLMDV